MTIPKKIHYCWVGGKPKPKSVLFCIESWKKYCPDYEIIEWNETNYDFKKNNYMKQAYEAKKWGFVPDYARLDIIYQHGGIYLDTDVELVKNLDDLLENDCFFGFEASLDKNYYVNCGHGFGSIPYHDVIKNMRDLYNQISFITEEGNLNLIASPKYTTYSLKKFGLKCNNNTQKIMNMTIYSSDYFCPKVFETGKMKKTNNTYSIHHFTASWMDDAFRKELQHNQKICLKYGDKLGHLILLIESIVNKYGFIGLLKKPLIMLYEYFYSFLPLIRGYVKNIINKNNNDSNIIIFDTAKHSKNIGDEIIMDNCMYQLNKKIDMNDAKHISTHKFGDEGLYFDGKYKIVCGTNLLSCKMRKYGAWDLPNDLCSFKNVILMGVGFDSYNSRFDFYTKRLFHYMLSEKGYHSVRDSFSEQCLKKIGIKNVLNTACPTMWKLTPEHCSLIPSKKSKNVVCTVTDYNKDEEKDKKMIEILLKNYDKVYIWIQGSNDFNYVKELGYQDKLIIIPNSLAEYDEILKLDNLDYVGTRLHAGIRALTFKHRSIIVSIDNRAECISKDTGLPIIHRDEIESSLDSYIRSEFNTKINLPWNNINKWLSQFH